MNLKSIIKRQRPSNGHGEEGRDGAGAGQWAEAAVRCGTDKVRYMPFYWEHVGGLRDEAVTILEIGVFKGQSARMWRELFPHATLFALDINPDCVRYADPPRTNITIGSQADPATLDRWVKQVRRPIDLIIDDGSHVMEHLKTSFLHLFPKLRPGGIYAVEDLGTCYFPEYGGALRDPGTMMELLKGLVDDVNDECSKVGNPLGIAHMHFYDNICFLYKK